MKKIIICPNDEKINILNDINSGSELHSIKFMNINEFIKNYYFDYDDRAIYYLIDKYKYNIDVCRVYLNNLYYIDLKKKYNNKKLVFLQNLKNELIDNNLLYFNNIFRKYLNGKDIEVRHYYDLEKYIEDDLKYSFSIDNIKLNNKIYKFNTMEDEVNFICLSIRKLLDDGVDINHIYLSNASDDYYYIINKLFGYYNIPINIPYKDSIYSTMVAQDYLKSGELDLDNANKSIINKKIVSILSDLAYFDKDSYAYRVMLEDKLKNSYMSNTILDNAVNIRDLKSSSFNDLDYVFVLGFNLDSLPCTYKDIEYISDIEKCEVPLYFTSYLNSREKNIIVKLLSDIKNLTISYKLSSPFSSFYPSNLISDLGLEEVSFDLDQYIYSDSYNKIKLGEMLDKYYVYGEKDKNLDLLNSNYDINYDTYDNQFTGINHDLYYENLDYPLSLSYTSLNSYFKCSFKYYIERVLKIGDFTSTFQAFIGSLYHEILRLYRRDNFNLEDEWNKYLEKRDLSLSEKVLLVRIRKDLEKLIDVLNKQQLITGYDDYLAEKDFKVEFKKDVSVELVGKIDKIMMYKKIDDTYFSIIDYKSGDIDTHIEPLKYGLHMQLPIYLYLINKSKYFTSPIFTGIYYQNILFDYPNWSLKLDKEIRDNYLLKGYSTDNIDRLEIFDSTYQNSELIKSMKYSDDKGFGPYTKIINDDTMYDLINYTDKKINEGIDSILDGDFKINPKIYNKSEDACEYCTYKDLCYVRQKDIVLYDKVNDLSFLGGDE